MDDLQVSVALTEQDYKNYTKRSCWSVNRKNIILSLASVVLSVIFAGAIVEYIAKQPYYKEIPYVIVSYGWLFLFLLFFWLLNKFFHLYAATPLLSENGIFSRHKEVKIDEKGIYDFSDRHESFVKWDAIIKIEEDNTLIYFYCDSLLAYLVPKRSFKSEMQVRDFINRARLFWESARNQNSSRDVSTRNPWAINPTKSLSAEEDQ